MSSSPGPAYAGVPDETITIGGIATRIACLRFSNRVMLTVSQTPAFGATVRRRRALRRGPAQRAQRQLHSRAFRSPFLAQYLVEPELYHDGRRFFNVRGLLGVRGAADGASSAAAAATGAGEDDGDDIADAPLMLARRAGELVCDDCDGAELLLCLGLQSAGGGAAAEASVRSILAHLEAARPWRALAPAPAPTRTATAVPLPYAPTLRVGPGRQPLAGED